MAVRQAATTTASGMAAPSQARCADVGLSRSTDFRACWPTLVELVERTETSWPAALRRRAATVQSSFGITLKGSYWKWRMALRWVTLAISSSERSWSALLRVSGELGHVESECG